MFGSVGARSRSQRRCCRCDAEVQYLTEQALNHCPGCGSTFAALDPKAVNLPIGRWARWCLRADPRPLLVLALALPLWYFWEYRSPAAAMVAVTYCVGACFGMVLFGLLAAGRGVQLFLRSSCAARCQVDPALFRCRSRFWTPFILIAAVTFLMVLFCVPLRLAFLVIRPALDRVAERALADSAYAESMADEWAGVYRIAGVKVIGRTVVMYVGKKHGDYGFARVPGAVHGDLVFNRPGAEDRPGYHSDFPRAHLGDPVGERITGNWFVMYSSYGAVKLQPPSGVSHEDSGH
jgi:hypothetical protein